MMETLLSEESEYEDVKTPYYYAIKDLNDSSSLLALVREEVEKTKSLDCLLRMHELGHDVEGMLGGIATALATLLDMVQQLEEWQRPFTLGSIPVLMSQIDDT